MCAPREFLAVVLVPEGMLEVSKPVSRGGVES